MDKKLRVVVGFITASLIVAFLQSPVQAVDLAQWASSATASTEYAGYPASNVIGPPDADGCKSPNGVWIPLLPSVTESITLNFQRIVRPKKISIYQNNYRNAVSKVEVSNNGLEWIEVYSGDLNAGTKGTCNPTKNFDDILNVSVQGVDTFVSRVRITVDQSVIKNFQQIDAVSLSGTIAPTSLGLGKSLTFGAIARFAEASVPSGASIAITSDSPVCVAVAKAQTVTGKKAGTCKLKITVTPKSGSKVIKFLDIKVD